jgi:glycosyltransferase involved in cell wall biosynthesis
MAARLISIIINNFNYARFLRQSIDSALAQTHPLTEVIVVDDVSTDESRDIIRSYRDRIRPVLQEKNGGQAAALNSGFEASSGEVVIFLDADDYLYPEAVARVADAWRDGLTILQYRLHLLDAAGEILDLYPPPENAFDVGNVVPKLLATGRYEGTVTSGNAFGRAALERVMPIPPEPFRLGADGYLVSTVPFYGEVSALETPLGVYRLHGGNLWQTGPNLARRFRRALLHDLDKHRYLAERAAMFSMAAELEPGLRDYQHLGVRMASLCLDPAEHPFPSDTQLRLATHGIQAGARALLPRRRRALLALWFLAAGLLPRPLARRVVSWYLDPSSRSPQVRSVLRALRRATR